MTPIAGTESGASAGFDRYFAIGKLTWLINENHNVFVSFNTQPTTNYGFFGSNGSTSSLTQKLATNNTNATLNYTGKFIDKHLLLEVKGGWFNSTQSNTAMSYTGQGGSAYTNLNTPNISWRTQQHARRTSSTLHLPRSPAAAGC